MREVGDGGAQESCGREEEREKIGREGIRKRK